MEIVILQHQLVDVVAAIQNVRKYTQKISVATNMKMDAIIDELRGPMQRFEKRRPELMAEHIAQKEDGTFKTERYQGGRRYVFKSEEDEQAYLEVADKELTFDIELLTREEIKKLSTGRDQNGDSAHHFRHLKLITEGYANVPQKEPEPKTNEEE
jgi:hypothetical protein